MFLLNGCFVEILVTTPPLLFIAVQYAQNFLPLLMPLQSEYAIVNAAGAGVLALAILQTTFSIVAFCIFILIFVNGSTIGMQRIW